MKENIFYSCGKCNYIPIILNIDPYNNIIKHKCSKHGVTEMKLDNYLLLLNKNKNNHNINQYLKCGKHPGNDIICFNYEKQEYYCIECYRLKDKENDIRFFPKADIPNEIDTNEIEFIDINYNNNNDNFIKFLKNKNLQYNNIINNYQNLIKLNNILINSYENESYKKINIINIKHYINIIKSYDIYEDEYLKNKNSKELIHSNNIINFNKKYCTNLSKDDNYINLVGKNISNEGFNFFNNILNKENNPKIEIIDFSENNISNINSLRNAKCYNLKELYIYSNQISNIDILSNIKFNNLEILNLAYNNIFDLSPLNRGNFYNLQKLYLYYNHIEDISFIENEMFKNLIRIDLSYNEIKNINSFKGAKFMNLKKLFIGNNKIDDITVFKYIKFRNLIVLDLSSNKIEDISPIENVFHNLKELFLYNNNINSYMIKNKDIILNFKTKIEKFSIYEFLFIFHNKIQSEI